MSSAFLLGDDVLTQLYNGIFSWQFLEFIVAFLSFFVFVLGSAVILVLAERKVVAWIQDRYGPLHVGPWGLLQTVADMGKLLLKEDIQASQTDKLVFLLAPSVFLAPIIAAFAVLPFSPYVGLPGTALATGIVYYVAMSSIDVVGVVMAGWGSNNKYSLIGGLRAVAQMISYELPLVLALVGLVMVTSALGNAGIGTISIKDIMTYQASNLWPGKGLPLFDFIFKGFTPWAWFFLVQPLMLVIYYTCGLAETNRPPFDLPEAESELVAGYLTEYSGVRWAMFYLGEYGNMTIVSAIVTLLFLGGWSGPGVALGNIVLTALVFLIVNGLGLSNLVFLIVLGVMNWLMFFGFIRVVQGATAATTRKAQAPAMRAQQRVAIVPQLAERAGASGQKP